jgi:hypothetical protein
MLVKPLQVIGAFLLGLVAEASSGPLATSAEIRPRASGINITSVMGSGNGCPPGTFTENFSPDGTAITLGFDVFEIYIGPGTSTADRSKNCIIRVTADYRSGYTFGVQQTGWHGYQFMSDKMTGSVHSTYMFASNSTADVSSSTTTQASVTGGQLSDIYTVQAAIPENRVIWAPCSPDPGRVTLQVAVRIGVTTQDTKPYGNIDNYPPLSLVVQQVHLGWKPC